MPETYSSGRWVVKSGEEDAFVREWTSFVTWSSSMAGAGTFRLTRDTDRPSNYLSFAPWESSDALDAWRSSPEFRERLGRVRSHCEDFEPSSYELVTQVD